MTGLFDNHDDLDRDAHGAAAAAVACPDDLDLAGYADGRLDAAARDRIESHLAECAECIAAVGDARALEVHRAEAMAFVSAEVIAAAAALVPVKAGSGQSAQARPMGLGREPRRMRWLPWTTAAAASLLVSFIGYQAGLTSSPARADAADVSADVSFGLFAADETGDLDVFAAALPEASS